MYTFLHYIRCEMKFECLTVQFFIHTYNVGLYDEIKALIDLIY